MKNSNLIQVGDLEFEIFIPEEDIIKYTKALADRINDDYEALNPVFIIVLSGAFIFAADLLRLIHVQSDITVVKVKSYEGTESTGNVIMQLPPDIDMKDRHIVIVEDIIDTARTLHYFKNYLKEQSPGSIEIATLLSKPEAHIFPLGIKYVGKEIPNDFVVGYGLDYNGAGRNLRHIYKKV